MMAKEAHLHSDMAHARQSDGISVIFDQKSPASRSSRSRSRTRSDTSGDSGRSSDASVHRRRMRHRRRNRSSSSSRSSSPHSRSRSYPRCHRPSSRCRCDNHRRYGRTRHRRDRARSRSYSRSPSYDRYSSRRNRSRSRSSRRLSKRNESQIRHRASPHRGRSRSRSSGQSVKLNVHDKQELPEPVKDNAEKILEEDKLELPESVKPILSEQTAESTPAESTRLSPEPLMRVRPIPEKTISQSDEEEPDNTSSPSLSPKRKMISFSINNSVAKPTAAALSGAKVTPRVDSYEGKKPYGHWIPVRPGRNGKARKHAKSQ
ncbi:unnamed protein product [Ophioblennius macclurei]